MNIILIEKRLDTDLLIKDAGIFSTMGNDNEVLSGVPVEILFPFQVIYGAQVSPIYKQSTRLVNGLQVDQFFLYLVGGFRWVDCSACAPIVSI